MCSGFRYIRAKEAGAHPQKPLLQAPFSETFDSCQSSDVSAVSLMVKLLAAFVNVRRRRRLCWSVKESRGAEKNVTSARQASLWHFYTGITTFRTQFSLNVCHQ